MPVTTPARKNPTIKIEQDQTLAMLQSHRRNQMAQSTPPGTVVEIPGKDGKPITSNNR